MEEIGFTCEVCDKIFISRKNPQAHQHIHRESALRSGKAGSSLWEGSFDHMLKDCKTNGITTDGLQKLYNSLQFVPVFTAHPTEAMRRSKMEATRRIFATILELHNYRAQSIKKEEIIVTSKVFCMVVVFRKICITISSMCCMLRHDTFFTIDIQEKTKMSIINGSQKTALVKI